MDDSCLWPCLDIRCNTTVMTSKFSRQFKFLHDNESIRLNFLRIYPYIVKSRIGDFENFLVENPHFLIYISKDSPYSCGHFHTKLLVVGGYLRKWNSKKLGLKIWYDKFGTKMTKFEKKMWIF